MTYSWGTLSASFSLAGMSRTNLAGALEFKTISTKSWRTVVSLTRVFPVCRIRFTVSEAIWMRSRRVQSSINRYVAVAHPIPRPVFISTIFLYHYRMVDGSPNLNSTALMFWRHLADFSYGLHINTFLRIRLFTQWQTKIWLEHTVFNGRARICD